jgi:N-acetylmuramoyl-L-alanine amidase
MKYMILTSTLLLSSLIYGCAPKSTPPVVQTTTVKEVKPVKPVQIQTIPTVSIPLKKRTNAKTVVMLDAGHGGEDFGTHSLSKPRYQEKYLNMSAAMMVKHFLQQFGFEVLMTRSDDTFISLEQRAMLANEQKPRVFVSIHFNSAPSADAEGIEVFYFRNEENKARMNKSKALAQSILDKTIQNTQAKSRGVKHGNYAVIRETTMPAVLIEGGFLTNASEMEKIKNASYLKSLALGIAQGIQEYVGKESVLADNN